jgi:hypothetical protein
LEVSRKEWELQVKRSSVRLQWGPDHDPYGFKLERRAIQIGLRNEFAQSFAKEDILLIEDISDFVQEQYEFVQKRQLENLLIPAEKPLVFQDEELNKKLKISGNHE